MYRAGDAHDTSCPEITSTPSCSVAAASVSGSSMTAVTTASASCAAIASSCQSFYEVDAHGDMTTITRHRVYDPKVRGWWLAHANYKVGQPYWIDLFGTTGYQQSDSSVPLLIGFFQVPIVWGVNGGQLEAMVLIQLQYEEIAKTLKAYSHMDGAVVYIMEMDGQLVATSNGESIFMPDGSQKSALLANTEVCGAA